MVVPASRSSGLESCAHSPAIQLCLLNLRWRVAKTRLSQQAVERILDLSPRRRRPACPSRNVVNSPPPDLTDEQFASQRLLCGEEPRRSRLPPPFEDAICGARDSSCQPASDTNGRATRASHVHANLRSTPAEHIVGFPSNAAGRRLESFCRSVSLTRRSRQLLVRPA
jgi:hypothetical protein